MNYRYCLVLAFLAILLVPVTPITLAQEIPRSEIVWVGEVTGAVAPAGWNPMLPDTSWGVFLMYCSLFLYSSRDDVWIPYLAESFRWIDEYTFEVKIRPEARWWDGTPVTADDVKYTFDLAKRYTLPWSGYWDYFDRVEVVDAKTVRFVLKKINYYQLLSALHTVLILPKHRFEKLEAELGPKITEFKDDDPEKIIGCGPYRLLTWATDHWIYVRVDDWWGKDIFGLPRPKYVGRREYKDNTASALAYERGEHDVSTDFYPAIWEFWTVKKLARRTYFAHPPYFLPGDVILLYITYTKYPLNVTVVRRAIAHAIPYNDLVSKAYFNYSVRASPSMIIHIYPAYAKWIDKDLLEKYGYDYDLEKAKKILDEAGIIDRDGDGVREMPDGTKLGPYTIQVPYGWTDWMMMCEMIAENLRKIGIDVRTEFPDFSVWWDRIIRGTFDLVICWSAGPGFDHPWNVFRVVMDYRLTGPVGEAYPSGDWERYRNPEVAELLDAIAAETDPEKLAKMYSRLQEIALKDLPAIPLFYGAVWYEFSEEYWVGWPKEEDPRWFGAGGMWTVNSIPVYFFIAPKGETPTVPAWIKELQFPTSKLFEELAKVLKPPAPPVAPAIEERLSTLEKDVETIKGRLSTIESELTSLSRE
ncbi:MAG: ABC transporter substrate-binding protein [Thermoprotei archaeon]|nr:MAG: ABC transporter substrate-binding protein [Thermoprotei archaeon]RLF23030.1 MAG: ABC transporter substrate-binding protein [Thermoprotei archaeon]